MHSIGISRGQKHRGFDGGFTLVEILVSIAVLSLMLVIIAQLAGSISSATSTATKHIDVDEQSRVAFRRFSVDFGKMLKRPDVDYLLTKQGGNDFVSFYTESSGIGANGSDPTLSVVAYRVNSAASQGLQLERGAINRDWAGITYAFLTESFFDANGNGRHDPTETYTDSNGNSQYDVISAQRFDSTTLYPTTLPAINTANYQAVADQVFRFEYCFKLRDGALSTTYYNSTKNNQLTGTRSPLPTDSNFQVGSWWSQPNVADYVCTGIVSGAAIWKQTYKLANIESLVIAIAALDNKSRAILPRNGNTPDLSSLAGALPDAVDGQDIASGWNQIITRQTPTVYPPAGVPAAAANAVHVYQWYFRFGGTY